MELKYWIAIIIWAVAVGKMAYLLGFSKGEKSIMDGWFWRGK